MRKTVLNRVGLGLSALFLVTALGLAGCATQDQLSAAVKKAEDAAAKAEAAAAKAEAAQAKCEACAAKCQKMFEKGMQK